VNRAALLSLSHDDLIALILAQQAQIKAQAYQISMLSARVAELEAKLAAPGKTPDNSSLPPSKVRSRTFPTARRSPVAAALALPALWPNTPTGSSATLAACPHCAHAFALPT
jgi:transposase